MGIDPTLLRIVQIGLGGFQKAMEIPEATDRNHKRPVSPIGTILLVARTMPLSNVVILFMPCDGLSFFRSTNVVTIFDG